MMSTLYLLDLKSNSCAFAKKTWHFYELVFHMILEPLWQSGLEFEIGISIQYDHVEFQYKVKSSCVLSTLQAKWILICRKVLEI